MNLRQLQYFYDTAQNGSIARTAEKYTVPASSVSASIKRLEEELNVQLFTRTSNRLFLNEKGKLLAAELQIAFDRISYATRNISSIAIENQKINILLQARPKWVSELVAEYRLTHPNTSFILCTDYTRTDYANFDIVICETSDEFHSWNRFLLSTEILCVKAANNHPLANKELEFKQLKDEAFVMQSKGNGMRNLYERLCKKHGIKPNVVIECNDRQCLQYHVQANMALTIGAFRALYDNTQDQLLPIKVIDFDETQMVYVHYKKKEHADIHIKEFCDYLYTKRYVY